MPNTQQVPRPVDAPDAPELPAEDLLRAVAEAAADKKAIDPVALDLRGVSGYTDFFLVVSGGTDRQVKAIHDGINETLKKQFGLLPRKVEGLTESRWVLLDYLDVVVHAFVPEAREFYNLERLWGDVPRVDLSHLAPPAE